MKFLFLLRLRFIVGISTFVLISGNYIAQTHSVLLDPGHGGSDGGAPGSCGISEKFYNLNYSLDAYDKIFADFTHSWEAYITHDDNDDYLSISARHQMANNFNNNQLDAFGYPIPQGGVNFFLSIHCNSSTNNTAKGTEILYSYPLKNQENIENKK